MRVNERVVVTGLGIISCVGIGKDTFWKNLCSGKCGITKGDRFDISQYGRQFVGEIKNFHPGKYLDNNKVLHVGRASQMAIVASNLAIEDANLSVKRINKRAMGVVVGTTMGESQVIEEIVTRCVTNGKKGIKRLSPLMYPANTISGNVANTLKIAGHNLVFSTACSAGNYSIAHGFDLISKGRCDFMLAGGADALSRIAFTGFSRIFVMAPEYCQPFDKNRKGLIVSEGSAMLLMESLKSALNRKAPIYAEILGYGFSCDAQNMTTPSVRGISSTIKKALRTSQIAPKHVDYISAHGTGTIENDRAECMAIKEVFQGRANKIPVNSIKSMIGHAMGTASALEAASCCLTIRNNFIPPTINFKTPDPECDIDCVPNVGRAAEVDVALNNSFAFGGNNACVVFKKLKV